LKHAPIRVVLSLVLRGLISGSFDLSRSARKQSSPFVEFLSPFPKRFKSPVEAETIMGRPSFNAPLEWRPLPLIGISMLSY
jgi:hypothetical protein